MLPTLSADPRGVGIVMYPRTLHVRRIEKMLYYTLKRVLWFVPLLLGVATVTFFLLYILPGDPVLSM
ncbi:MAG: hypothetical protein ABIA59_11840, partial [Candidatus Latescibacterota bacterium]